MINCNLIHHELWDRARWRDTMFMLTPDLDHPAGLGPKFENYSAAQEIFELWHDILGECDAKEILRVSILHGTAPTKEEGYTVHFSTNPTAVLSEMEKKPQDLAFGSRFHFKETLSNQNLEWFIASFQRHKRYFVLPFPMQPTPDLSVYLSHKIWKTELHYRNFAEVKPNDLDAMALPK